MTTLFQILFSESIQSDLKKKYPQLSHFIDTDFLSLTPKYLQWAIKQLLNQPDPFHAKMIASLISAFQTLSNQNKIDNKDLNSYKTLDELQKTVMLASQKTSRGEEIKKKRETRKEMETQKETKVLKNDSDFLITIPATWEASCETGIKPKSKEEADEPGEGEYWCISNPFSRKSWDFYRQKGVKFIFIKLKNRKPNDRYHLIAVSKWPSGMIQFTDAKNSMINDPYLPELFGDQWESIESLIQMAE